MKQEITLNPIKHKVSVDCWGCDYLNDRDVIVKRGFLGLGQKTERKYYCSVLYKGNYNLELTSRQVNAMDLAVEECPCHFIAWKQTHAELAESVDIPVYHFRVEAGKVVWTTETTEQWLTRISGGEKKDE